MINTNKTSEDVVNVPIRLYTKYKGSKEDKEALALAICIKLVYGDSILRGVSVKKLTAIFNMSTYRAKRLINNINNYPELFKFDGNNVIVMSFKDKGIKYNRKSQTYISDYCKKVSNKFKNFDEIYHSIAKTLVEYAINSCERRLLSTSKQLCSVEFTQKNLSNIAGISRSQVSRLTSKMANNGEILKEKSQIKIAIHCVNEQTVAEYKQKNRMRNLIINHKDNTAYVVIPCKYSISNRDVTNSFQHVIYNNWTRVKSKNIRVKSFYDNPYDNPVNAMWS